MHNVSMVHIDPGDLSLGESTRGVECEKQSSKSTVVASMRSSSSIAHNESIPGYNGGIARQAKKSQV